MTGPRAGTRSRREFLQATGSCAAHLALMGATASVPMRALWAQQSRFEVVAQEPWGRLERIADGIWALVSTPLGGDRTPGYAANSVSVTTNYRFSRSWIKGAGIGGNFRQQLDQAARYYVDRVTNPAAPERWRATPAVILRTRCDRGP